MYELHLLFGLSLWLCLIAIFLRSSCASIFHPITFYLAFHGVVFVIRPFFQHFLELDSVYRLYGFWPNDEVKHITLLVVNLGLLCFFSSAMLTGNTAIRFWEHGAIRSRYRQGERLLLALLLASPLILLSIRYALSVNFGTEDLRKLARDAATFHTVYTDTSAYLVDSNLMLGAFGVAIAWAYRFRFIALLPFLSFVTLRLTVGWSRYTFVMTSMGLALLYLFDHRRKWIEKWMVLAGFVLLLVFSALSSQRALIADWIKGEQSKDAQFNQEKKHFFDSLDFANLEFVEYLVHVVPERTGTYSYFSDTLEILTAPIPRVLWPEKPVGPPIKLFNINEYGFPVGITYTLIGEGWQSLGYFGVIIWCTFAGAFMGRFYSWFVRHNASTFVTLYYCLCVPVSLQWFRDGLLLSLVKFPLFFVAPIAMTQLLSHLNWPRRKLVHRTNVC
ncbi:O-antigen polymerase [Bradyrhizobium sp. 187]|uniref:O-antigen polymerase n=1 Tax=Bradyrhizobium sp. 187 TaxID=2782655 RepID=UPI001FFF53CA|nr:O-antigen polymerase [Bradyrhizobium sp. 187]UPJ74482.1 oligosaccharide repeat unit polymerase [Bradyrhizobium sp. 187]